MKALVEGIGIISICSAAFLVNVVVGLAITGIALIVWANAPEEVKDDGGDSSTVR